MRSSIRLLSANRHATKSPVRRAGVGHWNTRLGCECLEPRLLLATDFLYVGDQGDLTNPNDDRILKLDAATGAFVATLDTSGPLIGPRGMILRDPSTLLVVNQNVNQPLPGEILRFNTQTGQRLAPLVPATLPSGDPNPDAPYLPRGMVLDGNTLYVADAESSSPSFPGGPSPTGRIRRYDATTGAFLNDIVAAGYAGQFHPTGLVFDASGALYVSLIDTTTDVIGTAVNPNYGAILRIDSTSPAPVVVAFNNGDQVQDPGETADLHAPEGLTFGPDGRLYVTSFRGGPSDTNKILIFNSSTNALLDKIVLDQAGQAIAFAEALVFGPGGRLFVPIGGDGPAGGSVRRYNVATKTYDLFVSPAAEDGPIRGLPWYLTFERTRPDTLAYVAPNSSWQNPANRLDVNNDTLVTPVGDVLRLVNALNARTIFDAAGRLPDPPVAPNTPPPFYDVNGDGYLTPALDVLPVINYLNGVTSGEGEAAASRTIVADTGSQARTAISSNPAATVTVLSPTWPVSGESGTTELTETSDAMDERPRTRDVPSTDPAPNCWHFDQAVTEVTDDPSLDPLPDGLAEDLATAWFHF